MGSLSGALALKVVSDLVEMITLKLFKFCYQSFEKIPSKSKENNLILHSNISNF